MRSKSTFALGLAVFVAGVFGYGLFRFRLGIDLTDEGAYLAWPLSTYWGDAPFSSELATLVRPVAVYLSLLFELHPTATLYELRLFGWAIHVSAFSVLACFLFRLSGATLPSLLAASLPLFISHIFGLAPPSYNTLSSDFLLIALSFWGLASLDPRPRFPFGAAIGTALFIATFSHPGLGLVAAVIVVHEMWGGRLLQHFRTGSLTATNIGVLVFLGCWIAFLGYFWRSGALATWTQRMAHNYTTVSFKESMPVFWGRLLAYPFVYSPLAMVLGLTAVITAGFVLHRSKADRDTGSRTGLGIVLVIALAVTFSLETGFFLTGFVMISLVSVGILLLPPRAPLIPVPPGVRFPLVLAGLAALVFATSTHSFNLYRSWMSGVLGLPFAFATGFTLLVDVKPRRPGMKELLLPAVLAFVVLCAIRDHHRNIQRDASPQELRAEFTIPKLRFIRSTPERVQALDELYDYLRPALAPGDRLIVYDDCPMIYFLFDARPAYGMAWAGRSGHASTTLAFLNDELNSHPLPRHAVRTVVDVSFPIWSTAPRTNYDHYPLNETVMAHYELERTIFPFEIWRLKSAVSREKSSPTLPGS